MAITVRFGTNKSDDRFLTKDITWNQEGISCDVFLPCDRINPVLFVDTSKVDLSDTNYMEITEFGRKYFITDITGDSGKTVNVVGHVDVLGTYDAAIRECPCIAARSTSHPNMFLQDELRLFNTYTLNQYITIGDIGEPQSIIIRTIGPGGISTNDTEPDYSHQ